MIKPHFYHYCERCKYITTVVCRHDAKLKVDVYHNCDNLLGNTPFLIRFGDKDNEYATVGFEVLINNYMEIHFEEWRRRNETKQHLD